MRRDGREELSKNVGVKASIVFSASGNRRLDAAVLPARISITFLRPARADKLSQYRLAEAHLWPFHVSPSLALSSVAWRVGHLHRRNQHVVSVGGPH